MKYEKLFSPIKINKMIVRNRIVAAPISETYEEKALGGAGIVICGHTVVEPGRSSFASGEEQSGFFKYEVEKTQSKIRKAHKGGAKASLEIFHAGQYARVNEGDYAIGPVDLIREDGVEIKAMDEKMMKYTAERFAQAALDAKNLGFDMIFMHFGHGWLPSQFLSPLFNSREDEYGGSIENRIRFPKMILEYVREAVGSDFPIDMRVSAVEWVEGSIDFEDTKYFVKSVEHLIDSVQISAGLDINHEGNVHMVTTNFKPHMVNADYAKEIKDEVNIPVACVGAVLNPDQAEQLLADGKVDLVAFGRSFLADPDWPNKAKSGREDDIVPCLRCLQCYHISTNRRNVGCSVNPRYCNEDFIDKELIIAKEKKHVVIIGAGPAGLKAAITADRRGHRVTLLEKTNHIGGALELICKEHYKDDIRNYMKYLKIQLEKSSVDVKLNFNATPAEVKKINPDVIVIAVGAKAITPPIKGIQHQNVLSFEDAISNKEKIGNNVVIIGGGTIGAEIGLELAELKNKNVTIVERGNEIASQGNMLYKIALRQKMDVLTNLNNLLNTLCLRINESNVIVKDNSGNEQVLPADTVIIATGVKSNRETADSFYNICADTYEIGDCIRPRKIMEATFEGYSIATVI